LSDPKPRKRGGVSMPCPHTITKRDGTSVQCQSNSRVLKTRRAPSMGDITTPVVTRIRECLKRSHRFETVEAVVYE